MATSLRQEIRQRKPFGSLEEEALLNIVRTSYVVMEPIEHLMKGYGVTGSQYNVLRILRGAQPNGLCRNDIRDRLLNRMPDVTRMLDRMEEAGLVTRSRDEEDRRVVTTVITAAGLRIVNDLDKPVEKEQQRLIGHLSDAQLRTLVKLLTLARNQA